MKAWVKLLFTLVLVFSLTACDKAFDGEKWSENPEERGSMMGSLQKKHELKGMTEDEIVELLGEPSSKQEEEEERQFVYYLGRASLGVDDSLLRLYFSEDGIVESYRITND
ncbi:hypothetical protein A7K91_08295 [Paenibacillus oryzae]|uniref:Lipoprotein SmpA/OmlA domain-containing protein n=1 Tax=Paenibacillus oryzae TaxID=1844972 RepID=A0A1A5YQQ1_9BACL|nr:hypothetical protein [Paenibacillus oryzae]OBR67730.1 hypothetical protein A7K91_08295 [Paenibacillus oryzae]